MTRRSSRISQQKSNTARTISHASPTAVTLHANTQPLTSRPMGSTRKRLRTSDGDDEDEDNVSEYRDNDNRGQSRRKKKKTKMPAEFRKVRGKRGLLERLAKDVPLDIIFEIFCYLDSSDLINLALTTRDLRSILMSKASDFVWRSARLNLDDLPPLPKDLSEFQYADFIFGIHCHLCSRKGDLIPTLWSFRTRCCRTCAVDTFPYFLTLKRAQPHDYRDANILPREVIPGIYRKDRKSIAVRHIGHTALTQQLREQYDALKTEEEIDVWISRKWEEQEALREHGRLCNEWYSKMVQDRDDKLFEERKDAILQKLDELGLREEAEIIINSEESYLFLEHDAVNQSKKLTVQAWNKMKSNLAVMLSEHKEIRIAGEHKIVAVRRYETLVELYHQALKDSDFREPYPLVLDVLTDQDFKKLIWNTSCSDVLSRAFLSSQYSQLLPAVLQRWRSAKILELVGIVQRKIPGFTSSDLYLAVTVFGCKGCKIKMHFPEMFYHKCCQGFSANDDLRAEFFRSNYLWDLCKGSCNLSKLFFDRSGSGTVKLVVEACGLDPKTASSQDLYAAEPLIECLTCSARAGSDRLFMGFRGVLKHRCNNGRYTVNSFGEETKDILLCEPSLHGYLKCAHCHREIGNKATGVRQHLENWHKLTFENSSEPDIITQQSPQTLKSMQDHWYWNTRERAYLKYEFSFRKRHGITSNA
ncbi:hypothetical protein GGU10DRAFT_390520 [Lentinula aff. detonsa]|uniref:F-box domain-containing protein n=1 Tax=Lentinula aff. detonsa TaxID=2804958 RepID=A0AA38KLG0_9AGAR|nr:hypothetical protein GGU10DRAFT_390520 [Lentinula aff. detonsa]